MKILKNIIKETFQNYAVLIFILLFIFVIQIFKPELGILKISNLITILNQTTVLGFTALGLTLVMIVGEIDLSMAGTIGLSATVFAQGLYLNMNIFLVLLITILILVFFSFICGILVTKLGVNSFLATVAVMYVTMGIQKAYTNGITIWIVNDFILGLQDKKLFGVPIFILFLLLAYILGYIIVNKTPWGFRIRIIGENINAAKEVGIKTSFIKLWVFIIAAVFYSFAVVIETIRVTGAIIYSGQPILLPAMAACFLGSTMFSPGKVNVIGTFMGSIFLILILNILTQMGLGYYFISLIQGLALLIAVIISNIKNQTIKQIKI